MTSDKPVETIPLFEERVHVGKSDIVTDEVRVTTSTEEHDVQIEDEIERGNLHVERIAVERAVMQAPEPRQDGDTLIVSIIEERLVVEKRLFVIEELRITRTTTTERVTIPETVRRMRATVAHMPTSTNTGREIDG